MRKIICEKCSTVYPESAEFCPVCGYSRNQHAFIGAKDPLGESEELVLEELQDDQVQTRGIFDFDAVNPDSYQEYDDEEDDEDEEDEQPQKSHTFLIIFLVMAIVAMLGLIGYLFFGYILPNRIFPVEPAMTTEATEATEMTETTIPTVPCTGIVMTSGKVELGKPGQFWLIHAAVTPEDTTDTLTYVSSDESIVTVSEEGRVTAVGEGDAIITLTCGLQTIECPVTVSYVEEPTAPATEEPAATEETAATEEVTVPEETVTEETAQPALKDVQLKLKKTDLSFSVRGVTVTLELDCDLTADEVVWTSSDANIVRVDDKGTLTPVGNGTATIVVTYGEQKAECIVRCKF